MKRALVLVALIACSSKKDAPSGDHASPKAASAAPAPAPEPALPAPKLTEEMCAKLITDAKTTPKLLDTTLACSLDKGMIGFDCTLSRSAADIKRDIDSEPSGTDAVGGQTKKLPGVGRAAIVMTLQGVKTVRILAAKHDCQILATSPDASFDVEPLAVAAAKKFDELAL